MHRNVYIHATREVFLLVKRYTLVKALHKKKEECDFPNAFYLITILCDIYQVRKSNV